MALGGGVGSGLVVAQRYPGQSSGSGGRGDSKSQLILRRDGGSCEIDGLWKWFYRKDICISQLV